MDQQLQTQMSGENPTSRAVSASRPMSEFCMERIGDEVVLFDSSFNRYHTLNSLAYDVWRLCDGSRSIEQIGAALDLVEETVSLAVEQLGESGLLTASESDFESTMHRRKMMKLVAAGAIGAVGIPVVASITRLGPEASATHCAFHCATKDNCKGVCTGSGSPNGECVNGCCVC